MSVIKEGNDKKGGAGKVPTTTKPRITPPPRRNKELISDRQLKEWNKMTKNVYAAMFNPMTEESVFGVLSIHSTRKGAEKAIREHKKEMKMEHDRVLVTLQEDCVWSYDQWCAWKIEKIEVQE